MVQLIKVADLAALSDAAAESLVRNQNSGFFKGISDVFGPAVAAQMAQDGTIKNAAVAAMSDASVQAQLAWAKGPVAGGSDLNNLRTPGVYRMNGATYTNLPPLTGGGLVTGIFEVLTAGSTATVEQRFARYGTDPETWWRTSRTETTWNEWQRFATAADLPQSREMTSGSSFDSYTTLGLFSVAGPTLGASLINPPYPSPIGVLDVKPTTTGSIFQEFRGSNGFIYDRTRSTSGNWTVWRQTSGGRVQGTFVGGEDAGTYTGGYYRGQWAVTQAAVDAGVAGLPAQVPGLLDVLSPTSTERIQMFYSREASPRVWIRSSSTAGGALGTWKELTSGGGSSATGRNPALANKLHVEAFQRRRGGVIGTAGKAAVAFRFDHYVNAFMANILPLLRNHGLPSSMAIMPYELNPSYTPGSTGITWADIQAMSLNNGVEFWSHSYTHDDAASVSTLEHEIVASRAELMTQMPQTVIEGWMMVGVGGTYYDGFGPIDRPEKFIDTVAGRLIMSTYAVSSGHMGGMQRPLTGDVQQGQAHLAIENDATADAAIAAIVAAQDTGTGVVLMSHPATIGQSGKLPLAELDRLFAFVAAERDAGRLDVLTVGGMSVADVGSSRRHDVLIDPKFALRMAKWSGAGWTASADGVKSPTTGVALRQSMSLRERTWLLGSPRELVVRVRSTGGASVTVKAVSTNFGSLDASKTVAVAAGSGWSTIRVPLVLPYNVQTSPSVNLAVEVSAGSGQSVEVNEVNCRAV